VIDDHSHGKPRPNGEGRLDVELALLNLLAGLADAVGSARVDCLMFNISAACLRLRCCEATIAHLNSRSSTVTRVSRDRAGVDDLLGL
jgi:hypothetical protein